MQLSWEDWGVLLWSGCCRQKSEFECPWRVHRGRSVCELYKPHRWHQLWDVRRRLLQTWRGKSMFCCHFTVNLGVQTVTSAQGVKLLKRDDTVRTAILWRLTSNSDSVVVAFHSWKSAKLTLTEIWNCVDMNECTWGQGLQLVFQFNLKEDVVL